MSSTEGTGGGADAPEHSRRHAGVLPVLREIVVVVITALALSLLVKTFLLQAFFIPSQSMQDTLQIGDRVLVNKLQPGPVDLDRGDVVVFKDPGDWLPPATPRARSPFAEGVGQLLTFVGLLPQDAGDHLIKRIIGLPGDRVMCCDDQQRLTVNGAPLQEPYTFPGSRPSEREFEVTVPEDRLWVMGDNRQMSEDSRYHQDLEGGGTVPVDSVVGRAFVVVWPFDRFGLLRTPEETFTGLADGAQVR